MREAWEASRGDEGGGREPAPAHIAPSSDITLAAGWAPPLLSAASMRTVAASSGSPACSARATSGSRPASAIRFGSSKSAETWTAA
ncbi:hypothetical protein RB628_10575 [Streptomyces sp. ADMS]|uniref:hypothetical protein n=1 Tax=Streptomyces sp. ADMS TaxID=3071415 RepID=UPI00296FD4BA|nr:hypothetical protein [Streptomyces sp. ADMS]MDW4905771.1 hypothetical protein [Streptomyces sp. ADMS]